MHLVKHTLLLTALALLGSAWVVAQTTRPTAATPGAEEDPSLRLGEIYSSRAAGIAFRPPAGGVQKRRLGYGTDIVQYSNAEERWMLKVSRLIFEKPAELVGLDDPTTPAVNEALTRPGVLDQAAHQLTASAPGTRILRKDVINIGPYDAGILIVRYTQGPQTWLRQQAILMANDQLYYVLDFNTPSGHTPADPADNEDPAEVMAVGIFNAVLDTIQLLDQRPIRVDNDERLFRTRTLLVNIRSRAQRAVASEQYFRVLRGGKDVGWSFVSEEIAQRQGQTGVLVAVASFGRPEPGVVASLGSEMFCSLDLKTANEAWVTVSTYEKDAEKNHMTEVGQSVKRIRRIFDEKFGVEDEKDPRQPRVRISEQYTLNVTQSDKSGSKQISRDLPPFYLPQAVGAIMPRLVPFNEPKGYLFVSWVASERELIHHYFDVEPEREVTFHGKTMRALVVRERIGLEGDPTLHYLTSEGKYLGNVNAASGVTMVATDAATITRLWPEARLVRPRLLDAPPTAGEEALPEQNARPAQK